MNSWDYAGASESLKKSALVSGRGQVDPREALILQTLLNHPWLVEEQAEQIAAISFANPRLARLRDEILNLNSGDKPLDSEGLNTQLKQTDAGATLAQVERAITHKSDWFAQAGASRADVETGWRQILALHRRGVELGRELEAAQRAFDTDASDSAFERLCDIHRQLVDHEGIEASVEGYGDGPDRQARRAG